MRCASLRSTCDAMSKAAAWNCSTPRRETALSEAPMEKNPSRAVSGSMDAGSTTSLPNTSRRVFRYCVRVSRRITAAGGSKGTSTTGTSAAGVAASAGASDLPQDGGQQRQEHERSEPGHGVLRCRVTRADTGRVPASTAATVASPSLSRCLRAKARA